MPFLGTHPSILAVMIGTLTWNASVKPRLAAAPVPRCVLTIPAVLPQPKDLPGLSFPQGNRFTFKLTAFSVNILVLSLK